MTLTDGCNYSNKYIRVSTTLFSLLLHILYKAANTYLFFFRLSTFMFLCVLVLWEIGTNWEVVPEARVKQKRHFSSWNWRSTGSSVSKRTIIVTCADWPSGIV